MLRYGLLDLYLLVEQSLTIIIINVKERNLQIFFEMQQFLSYSQGAFSKASQELYTI